MASNTTLSAEQWARMERNRQVALERRRSGGSRKSWPPSISALAPGFTPMPSSLSTSSSSSQPSMASSSLGSSSSSFYSSFNNPPTHTFGARSTNNPDWFYQNFDNGHYDEDDPPIRVLSARSENIPVKEEKKKKKNRLSASGRRAAKAEEAAAVKPESLIDEGNRDGKYPMESMDPAFDIVNPPSTISDGGLPMKIRNKGKKSAQYICGTQRHKNKGGGECGCDRKTSVNSLGSMLSTGNHVSACYFNAGQACPDLPTVGNDYRPEHKEFVECSARDTSKTAIDIWEISNKHFLQVGGPNYRGLTRMEVKNLVNNYRVNNIGGDPIQQTEALYSGTSSDAFLRKSELFHDTKNQQRVMLFSRPALLTHACYEGVQAFVDATFSCVPAPFYQCLVLMIYEQSLNIYVPIIWALMTGKTEACYWAVFKHIEDEIPEFNPVTMGVDFERGFFKTVLNFFPDAKLIGCLFHFKQATRKKMKVDIHIPDVEIYIAMATGMLDLITVLPADELWKKGIPFVRMMINEAIYEHYTEEVKEGKLEAMPDYQGKWDTFWAYFENFWMQEDFVKAWNLSDLDEDLELISRTSNGLERYNRRMGGLNPTSHPRLGTFVSNLKIEADNQLQRIEDIKHKREDPPTYEEVVFPEIPQEYEDYRGIASPVQKKKKRRARKRI